MQNGSLLVCVPSGFCIGVVLVQREVLQVSFDWGRSSTSTLPCSRIIVTASLKLNPDIEATRLTWITVYWKQWKQIVLGRTLLRFSTKSFQFTVLFADLGTYRDSWENVYILYWHHRTCWLALGAFWSGGLWYSPVERVRFSFGLIFLSIWCSNPARVRCSTAILSQWKSLQPPKTLARTKWFRITFLSVPAKMRNERIKAGEGLQMTKSFALAQYEQ